MFHWIEAFYNPTRRYSTLGYLRPIDFGATTVAGSHTEPVRDPGVTPVPVEVAIGEKWSSTLMTHSSNCEQAQVVAGHGRESCPRPSREQWRSVGNSGHQRGDRHGRRGPLRCVSPQVSAGRRDVPSAGFEPAHMAPEANALSPELRGRGLLVRAARRI